MSREVPSEQSHLPSPPICIANFESLPNELFFEIFQYLSVLDLYDGFYTLNSRFRTILALLTNLFCEVTCERELYSPAHQCFASRITTLKMYDIELIDITPFSNVRSLTLLSEPNRLQCQWILLLPCLKYLYVVQCPTKYFYYSVSLPSLVFNKEFPRLHTCQLNLVTYRIHQNWTSAPSLHTLSICIENPRVVAQILQTCPSLTCLQVELTPHFARPPTRLDTTPHLFLRRFHFRLNETMFPCCDIIGLCLYLMPNLIDLKIRGLSSTINQINIAQLGEVLLRCVPELQHFYFDMAIEESLVTRLINADKHETRKYHPLFTNTRIYLSTQKSPARLIIGI